MNSAKSNLYNRGYMTLISVLIIGVIASVVAVTVIMTGIAKVQTSGDHLYGASALALANACVELGLDRVRSNANYTGTSTEDDFQNGTCSYTVTSNALQAQGETRGHVRRIEILFESKSPMVFGSWLGVSDFSD